MLKSERPIVMAIGGHDPSGGAGIQADMEAISYTGSYPVTVITCLTIQDTQNVEAIQLVDADFMQQQAEKILADMPVSAFKLGLLGSIEVVDVVCRLLKKHKPIPVVCDPVLAAGGGKNLSNQPLIEHIKEHLFPLVSLLTPNIPEAIQLGIARQHSDDGSLIFEQQLCENILITGTHSHSDENYVHNTFYSKGKQHCQRSWRRLDHEYHGSGCTLAANIAGWIAQGFSLQYAIGKGQEFTWNSLKRAQQLGQGQLIPYRL